MRKTLGVSLLVLLLTGSASAGEIPYGSPSAGEMPFGSPAPPPSQAANAVQEPTLDGIMPNGANDTLTQTALDLLAVLSSLL